MLNNKYAFNLASISGIYVIINRKASKFYVGESINIEKRWKSHLSALRSNNHENYKLQEDFNLYGEDSFEFKLLLPHIGNNTFITKAELLILENVYIKRYENRYKLYNIQNSLNDILYGKHTPAEINPKYGAAFRRTIADIILSHEIEWIEDCPYLAEQTLLCDAFNKRITQRFYRSFEKQLPKDIMNSCLRKKSIEYLSEKEITTKISFIVTNEEPLLTWLRNNEFTKRKDFHKADHIIRFYNDK